MSCRFASSGLCGSPRSCRQAATGWPWSPWRSSSMTGPGRRCSPRLPTRREPVPYLAGALFLSGMADRYPRREVMVTCDVVRAALVAAMLVPRMPLDVLIALLYAVTAFQPPFDAARFDGDPSGHGPGRALRAGRRDHAVHVPGHGGGGCRRPRGLDGGPCSARGPRWASTPPRSWSPRCFIKFGVLARPRRGDCVRPQRAASACRHAGYGWCSVSRCSAHPADARPGWRRSTGYRRESRRPTPPGSAAGRSRPAC